MTERDFVYWLQGWFELQEKPTGLTKGQVQMVKDHLALVFEHIVGQERPAEKQAEEPAKPKEYVSPSRTDTRTQKDILDTLSKLGPPRRDRLLC